jgi:hypothetical protein
MSEQMNLQALFRHELIHQQSIITIRAIANELYKILEVKFA